MNRFAHKPVMVVEEKAVSTTLPPDERPVTRRTTLGEHPMLPIGLPSGGGSRARTVVFKRWMLDDEMEIGALAARESDQSQPRFYVSIVAQLLTHLGDHDLTSAKLEEKKVPLQRLYAADFLVAWTLLRIEALGKKVQVHETCPACKGEPFDWEVDLTTMPIVVAEDHHPLRREVRLRDGFEARGKRHESVTIAPFRWMAYDLLVAQRQNMNALRASIVRSSIVGLSSADHEIVISEVEMRKGMTKADFELLFSAAHDDHLGPDFSIEPKCPWCGHVWEHHVPWEYGSFFSSPGSSP